MGWETLYTSSRWILFPWVFSILDLGEVQTHCAAGVLGAFHLILSIGLGVSLMQLDDSWRRGDGEDPSVIIFFVLAIAATGVNQIFTAFYPGMEIMFSYTVTPDILTNCLLWQFLSTIRDPKWQFYTVKSSVIVTFAYCGTFLWSQQCHNKREVLYRDRRVQWLWGSWKSFTVTNSHSIRWFSVREGRFGLKNCHFNRCHCNRSSLYRRNRI